MSGLLDSRGCLTDQGLAAMASAPVGQAPPELATHLAGCSRCQDRLLGLERTAAEARGRGAKQPYRNLVMFGLILLATLTMLGITLAVLSGR